MRLTSVLKKSRLSLAQTEAELDVAVESNQDDLAMVLIQKKNALQPNMAELTPKPKPRGRMPIPRNLL